MALYGFHELADIAADRVLDSDQLIDRVDTAIRLSVEEHNRQMNALLGLFVERTTKPKGRFLQTSSHRLQPLDNNGRALPVKITGHYDVAWPIQEAGSAWGANYVTRAKMTLGDAERITSSMLIADKMWMQEHLMAALFAAAPWTFSDDINGDLIVEPLADGGTETYQMIRGAGAMATDNHIRGFANAINDGADNALISLADDLREHPENMGRVVFIVDTDTAVDIAALDTFYEDPDPNLRVGVGSTELVGTLETPVPGDVLGYEAASRSWVVVWQSMPLNYVIGVTTEGMKPLRMREDPEPVLQGFNMVAERNNHPFYESQFLRRAGFGAWNRIGAVVAEIEDSSYDVPANYAVPMP